MNNAKFFSSVIDGSPSADGSFPAVSISQFKILARMALLFLLAGPCLAVFAQTNEWVWMGGSSVLGTDCEYGIYGPCRRGVYGTLGTPAPGNIPGSRSASATAVDSSGNLWLFGGGGYDSAGNSGTLNDLWEFNPSTNQWTWISGSNAANQSGVYGTVGVPGAGNVPGGRDSAAVWMDGSGNLWLFGGEGYDANGGYSQLNDLWEFNPTTTQWTWMAGNSTLRVCGIAVNTMQPIYCPWNGFYGALGLAATGNLPGGREGSVVWEDGSGSVWIFGGVGALEPGGAGLVNELWKYIPSSGTWGWMGGCSSTPATDPCPIGIYGNLGEPSIANIPGARVGAVGWTDKSGNLWLLGGNGDDSAGNIGDLNDLWEFSPSTNEWAWMGGSSTLNACGNTSNGQPKYCSVGGTYGTLGVPATGNVPGSRAGAIGWTDKGGNFWLFGGSGYDSAGNEGILNDLWEFNPLSGMWTWMGGSSTVPQGCASANQCGQTGVYGTLGTPAAGNMPGARDGSVSWTDASGNLWLFGGNGYDSTGTLGGLNDVWEFSPLAPMLTAAAPSFSPAAATFASVQTVTISDAIAGATIYYTTDGTAPTTNSTVYGGAITVSNSETIEAIATASGYSSSAVTTAAYVINLPPSTFTFGASPASVTVHSGGQGSVNLTVTPQNGFSSTVSFACTGLSPGETCSFSPATVKPSGAAVSTQLTLSPGAQSSALRPDYRPLLPGTGLALVFAWFGFKRRRVVRLWLLPIIAGVGMCLLYGCGGSGSSSKTPVTTMVIVSASSGSLQQTVTIAFTVN